MAQKQGNRDHSQQLYWRGDVAVAPREVAAPIVVLCVEQDVHYEKRQSCYKQGFCFWTKPFPKYETQQYSEKNERVEQKNRFFWRDQRPQQAHVQRCAPGVIGRQASIGSFLLLRQNRKIS